MSSPLIDSSDRRDIYYWKCDRPAAFHGTQAERMTPLLEPQLHTVLEEAFPETSITLHDAHGQGNHLTWIAEIGPLECFIRVEDGPERDQHLEVESHVINRVRQFGVPTPHVYQVDAQRKTVPFAWQVMELIPVKDLNQNIKSGTVAASDFAEGIGAAIARWQSVPVSGFGHFDSVELRRTGELRGFHSRYADYFFLNWDRHLSFLESHHFLTPREVEGIRAAAQQHAGLLNLTQGCLVHKDLAFWNILGDRNGIAAFIDWDDAVAADEMDDLSLLGCFHDGPFVSKAMQGYQSVKPLPVEAAGRFWLHLLRNMIVKSVIRVGAGYFERDDAFFLIGNGMTGAEFKQSTRTRLFRVLQGLRHLEAIEDL